MIPEPKTLSALALPNRLVLLDNHAAFFQVFGQRLDLFWQGNLLGFDVIKFDEFIKPEENESTLDAIQRTYGLDGVGIIKRLLHIQD